MEEQTHLHSSTSNSHAQQWKWIKFSEQLSVLKPYGEHRFLSGFLKTNEETVQRFWTFRLALHRSQKWKHGESLQNHYWTLVEGTTTLQIT